MYLWDEVKDAFFHFALPMLLVLMVLCVLVTPIILVLNCEARHRCGSLQRQGVRAYLAEGVLFDTCEILDRRQHIYREKK